MENRFRPFTPELIRVLGIGPQTQTKEINGKKRMQARRRCIKEELDDVRYSLFKQHGKPLVVLFVLKEPLFSPRMCLITDRTPERSAERV